MQGIKNAILAGCVLTLVSGLAVAEEDSLGQREYRANCAVCHGVAGKGNGPYAELLRVALPDLTQLTKDNGGVFPFDRVHEIIDGRVEVKAHGPRGMPVWGNNYSYELCQELVDQYRKDPSAPFDAESFVRERIHAVISHLKSMQEE